MSRIKFLLFSDLHLERNDSSYPSSELAQYINIRLNDYRESGYEPVILAPGDISNGKLSFEFLSKIESKIFFTPGNHEFWANDFFETSKLFKSALPANVELLNNSVSYVDQYLIIGSTLWTDSGVNLNPDISIDASSRMNDMSYIKAAEWYSDKANISELKSVFSTHSHVDDKINNLKWNFLIELEENQKSWNFINDLSLILQALDTAESLSSLLFDSTSDIENDTFLSSLKMKLDYTNPDLEWSEFLQNMLSISTSYGIKLENKLFYSTRDIEKNKIFLELKAIPEISKKNIIMMTHHLPFYEEFFVGYNELEQKPQLNTNLLPETFLVRKGREYPSKNYISKSLRGEIPRFSDVSHIVNYSNNGSSILHDYLLNKIDIWVHGHEHYFRYQNFLKGIFFCTNPSGQAIREFGRSYKSRNLSYIESKKIIDNILMPISSMNSISSQRDSVLIEILKNADWKSIKDILTKLGKASHEILILSTDLLKTSILDNSKKSAKGLNEKLHFWVDCYTMIKSDLNKYLTTYEVFLLARLDPTFNVQSYALSIYKPRSELFRYFLGHMEPPSIGVDNSWITIAKSSFTTLAIIRIAEKNIGKISSLLQKDNISVIELNSSLPDTEEINLKINENWNLFFNKFQSK